MEGEETCGVSVPSRLPDPSSAPWLVFLHGKHGRKSQTFFSITSRRFYVRSIKEFRKHYCMKTSFEWFLMLDDESGYFLWSPVTTDRFELPPIPDGVSMTKCILSSPPTDPDCVVMCCKLLKNYVTFCRPGDKAWICHHYDTTVTAIESCRGNFYGFTWDRKLLMFNFDPEPRITVLDIITPGPARTCTHVNILLESCGEIFLIHIFLMVSYGVMGDLQVLKLDLAKQRWDEVDDIGDKVFFLNVYGGSLSSSASELGIKKGCIYFTERHDNHLYVYDLEEGTLSRSLPCPNLKEEPRWRPFFLLPSPAL